LFTTNDYYVFTLTEQDSITIQIDVTIGPAVTAQLISSDCAYGNLADYVLTSIDCFYGPCLIPISGAMGDLFNSSSPYYIIVSGVYPSQYNIAVLGGSDQTCTSPNTTGSDLCDVSWTVWNYQVGDTGFDNQNLAALRLYNQLVEAFVPTCEDISESCNNSLIQYACTSTYRACDFNGFQASICGSSCQDVENNCGSTFEQVGLPLLSCNHNFYYTPGDAVCDDIYDVSDGNGGNKLLWLIALVVIFLVILIFGAIGAFLIYKKWKTSRQKGSYESIEDNNAGYEDVEGENDD